MIGSKNFKKNSKRILRGSQTESQRIFEGSRRGSSNDPSEFLPGILPQKKIPKDYSRDSGEDLPRIPQSIFEGCQKRIPNPKILERTFHGSPRESSRDPQKQIPRPFQGSPRASSRDPKKIQKNIRGIPERTFQESPRASSRDPQKKVSQIKKSWRGPSEDPPENLQGIPKRITERERSNWGTVTRGSSSSLHPAIAVEDDTIHQLTLFIIKHSLDIFFIFFCSCLR